jgi:uncharacterized membrane protein YgcG
MKKIGFTIAFVGLLGVSSLAAASLLTSDASAQVSSGINAATTSEMQGKSVNSTVGSIVNILLWVVGILSVTMIVWSGFKYITSAGDTSKLASAKSTLIYAVVGLIIAILAYAIVTFVRTQVVSTGKSSGGTISGGHGSGGGSGSSSGTGSGGAFKRIWRRFW